ncbi:MAG: RNA 2',3'-cyclic phosphodiesterase [Candidatus Zipacnadales bacterium]
MRLFFGISISESVRTEVESAQEQLRRAGEKVKWVAPANLHITLRFLGEVSDTEAEQIAHAAESCWEGVPVQQCVLRGVGAFPNPRHPRVIWIGLGEGRETFTALYKSLNGRLQECIGMPRESREFVPHLTIGRVKVPPRKNTLARLIDELSAREFGSFLPDQVVLYMSTLTPRGPIYNVVRSYSAFGSA